MLDRLNESHAPTEKDEILTRRRGLPVNEGENRKMAQNGRPMNKLGYAFLALAPIPVLAQTDFTTTGSFIEIKGKWEAVSARPGERLVNKALVQIECFKDAGHCKEATFSMAGGDPDLSVSDYTIRSWDENGIVAVNDAAACLTSKLVINFQDHNVIAIDAPKSREAATAKSCTVDDQTQTYRMVK